MYIVRRWLECAPCDFTDPTMRTMLVRFLERDVRKRAGMEQHAAGLLRLISDNDSTSSLDCSHSGSSSNSSRSSEIEIANVYTYLDTPIAKLELLSVDPCVLAEQLTLIDHGLFRRISIVHSPIDFSLALSNDSPQTHWLANCGGKWTNTPVQALAQRFNNISAYFAFEIVTTFHLKKRAALLKHLIVTARRLFALNNFHGLMAVLSALRSEPITRLISTHSCAATLPLVASSALGARCRATFARCICT